MEEECVTFWNILLPHVFAYRVGRVCGVSSILKLIAGNSELSIRLKINIKAKMTKLARGSLKKDKVYRSRTQESNHFIYSTPHGGSHLTKRLVKSHSTRMKNTLNAAISM